MGKREEGLPGLEKSPGWDSEGLEGVRSLSLALGFYLYYFLEL